MSDGETVEVWLPVAGYEGLSEASNFGRVRRAISAPARSLGVPGQVLTPTVTTGGYLVVSLSRDGQVRNHRLHRVVLSSFCGPPPFDGAHGAHNDGDRSNNALANLRWASPVENQADVDRHGRRCRGADVHSAVLNDTSVRQIRARCARGEAQVDVAARFGVSPSTVHLIHHKRFWRHVA